MKITISNNQPTNDLTIWADERRINLPNKGIFAHYWDESDLEKLLTEKQMKDFENGQCDFNVPDWKINLLTGKASVGYGKSQRERLLFLSQFD